MTMRDRLDNQVGEPTQVVLIGGKKLQGVLMHSEEGYYYIHGTNTSFKPSQVIRLKYYVEGKDE